MNRKQEREAWTAWAEGRDEKKAPKYGNERAGKYPSKHQAEVAGKLHALAKAGKIHDLEEEVDVILVPGKHGVRPVIWRADFIYTDAEGVRHYLDAKGFRTQVYKLKKRLALLLLNLEIEEV